MGLGLSSSGHLTSLQQCGASSGLHAFHFSVVIVLCRAFATLMIQAGHFDTGVNKSTCFSQLVTEMELEFGI